MNNCFSIYHTSWITSHRKSNFICDSVPTKAILFFFGCSEVNNTWLINSELANQRTRKVLNIHLYMVYTNRCYGLQSSMIALFDTLPCTSHPVHVSIQRILKLLTMNCPHLLKLDIHKMNQCDQNFSFLFGLSAFASYYLDCFVIWRSEKGLSIAREVHTPYSCRVGLEYCALTFSLDNSSENYVRLIEQ